MEACQKRRGKMRKWVETFANNLIGRITLLFDALRIRRALQVILNSEWLSHWKLRG